MKSIINMPKSKMSGSSLKAKEGNISSCQVIKLKAITTAERKNLRIRTYQYLLP